MGVTKTDYMRGMQCPKMLWLDGHKREERVIPPEVQEKLDLGNEFGDEAMGMFGAYEEMTAYKADGRLDHTAMIKRTKACIEGGTPVICEAAFSVFGHYCAVDILRKTDGGYEMYEVKNSDSVKEQFVKDVGFQLYIAVLCGVQITRCFVVYRGEEDGQGAKYRIEDVTERAEKYAVEVKKNIFRLSKVKQLKEEPTAQIGARCDEPYECWYKGYCARLAKKENGENAE